MCTLVNIGLATNDGTPEVIPQRALDVLVDHGAIVLFHYAEPRGREPTLIAQLARPLSPTQAYSVAALLHQDCIAQRVDGVGELYGPGADKWAPFNNDYFLGV